MSKTAARAVADGIRQSQVKKLRLHHATELGISSDASGIRHFLDISPEQQIRELMLDVVDLSEEDLTQLANSLMQNKYLSKLDFILESGFSEQGADALALGLQNSHLTCLRLSLQTNISELREIMYRGIQQTSHLQRLEIASEFDEWNSVSDIGDLDGILTSLPSINTLSINGICCIESLAEGLRNCSSLTTLELRWQELDDVDMPILCGGLRDSSCVLTKLNLGRNPINDQGIGSFVHYLENQNSRSIQELILDHMPIRPIGTQQLMRAVATNLTSLKILDLSWNTNIGYNGLKLIGEELSQLRLHKLKLTGCIDTDLASSMDPAQVTARRQAGCALLQGIQDCVHLRMMDVQQNGMDDDLVQEIEFYYNLNRHGRFLLEQHDDGLVPALWCRVLDKCEGNASFVYFFLREQPNLVSM